MTKSAENTKVESKKRRILGLAGYAKVGKDTAAANLPGWMRFAFADPLKSDLMPLLAMVGCDMANMEHKEKVRPLMVAWGATARKFQPEFWIRRTLDSVARGDFERVVITDVRYLNEVRAIEAMGGIVIRIDRPEHGPANAEEARSFSEMENAIPDLKRVVNDKTPEKLAERVLRAAGIDQ